MRRCRALGLAAVLLGLTASAAFAQTSLTWTAGQLGGGWYDISTGIAALLREKADITVKVIRGGGCLADYDPSKGWLHLGVALHPGAERYYREKGWLHVSVPARGDRP